MIREPAVSGARRIRTVVVPGCPTCKKRLNTMLQFLIICVMTFCGLSWIV
jgi:hypothetical protein